MLDTETVEFVGPLTRQLDWPLAESRRLQIQSVVLETRWDQYARRSMGVVGSGNHRWELQVSFF